MKRLQRLGAFGWLVALGVGLVLLVVVSPYLGDALRVRGPGPVAGSASEVPPSPTALRAGLRLGVPLGQRPDEPEASDDSFLRDYNALAHDQAIVMPGGPGVGDTVGFLAKFGLVLVLLYGSLRALRSFMIRQRGMTSRWARSETTPIAEVVILETAHLSPHRALYLVGAGPKVLLLGGTDQQITFLAELADMDLEGRSTDDPELPFGGAQDRPFDGEALGD